MADGEVVFRVDADDREAQKKLNQLRRDIDRTAKSMEATGAKKDGITRQLEDARAAARQTAAEIEKVNAELAVNQKRLAGESIARRNDMAYMPIEDYRALKQTVADEARQRDSLTQKLIQQQAGVTKLEAQEQKVLAVLQQQSAQLETQKGEAGAIERTLATQSTSVMPQLAAATEQVSKSMRKGFKNILKWGLGIRSAFVLMRRLRSAIKEGISAFAEQDEETKATISSLKASLQTLKTSWGAAFAPILNAVAPILQTLISWLTAAANAIQSFFALLGGKTTFKKAITNNEKLADSFGGAGGAAEKAEKQVLGFDEINKLNENSGGGGGGGGGSPLSEFEEVEVSEKMSKFFNFVKDHLTEIAALAAVVGAALLAWRISKALGLAFTKVFGVLVSIAGLVMAIKGYFNAWQTGVSWTNLKEILIGVGLLIGGLALAFGPVVAAIAAVISGVAMLVLGFKEWITTGELSVQTFYLIAAGLAIIGIALAPLTGGWSLLVAAIAIAAVMIAKYWDKIKDAWNKSINRIKEEFGKFTDYFKERIDAWRDVLPDNGSAVAFAFIMGIIDGIWDATFGKLFQAIGEWGKKLITKVKEVLPSTSLVEIGREIISSLQDGIAEKWNSFEQWFHGILDGFKQWWGNFSLGAFHLVLPHITYSLVTVPILGTIPDPRTMSIEWYAKGGIVDGATLIGAGEAGKEAIVPLERNTEWINMVARGLVDNLTSSSRLADYVSNLPLPSIAQGQIVPPRALSNGGSMFTDGDIQRLVSGITAAFTQDSGEQSIKLYLDGKQIAETVTRHQRRMERGMA